MRAEVAIEEKLDAAADAPPSLAVLEQRKRQRLSEWKGSLTEEDTVRNTNFAPIGGDWRDRVARARQRKAAEGAERE